MSLAEAINEVSRLNSPHFGLNKGNSGRVSPFGKPSSQGRGVQSGSRKSSLSSLSQVHNATGPASSSTQANTSHVSVSKAQHERETSSNVAETAEESDDDEKWRKKLLKEADLLQDLLEGPTVDELDISPPAADAMNPPLVTPLTDLTEATSQLSIDAESSPPNAATISGRRAPISEPRAVSPLEYMDEEEAEQLQAQVRERAQSVAQTAAERPQPSEAPRSGPRKRSYSALRAENEDEENEDELILRAGRRKTRSRQLISPDSSSPGPGPRRSSRVSRRSSRSRSASSEASMFTGSVVEETPEGSPDTSPSPDDVVRYIDGIPMLSWKHQRAMLIEDGIKCYWARDIETDTGFHDRMNAMSTVTLNFQPMREVYKGYIRAKTSDPDDEPDAPQIEFVNDVDAAATPPWEFYYSNRMWFGEGLSPPDVRNLVGCDCIGKCNPRNKNCACVKRQQVIAKGEMNEFAYTPQKRLKTPNIPIVECNMLCQCDETCQNRVVQGGRQVAIRLQKTKNKGWGVFASQKIPMGTYIGIYAGELLTEEEGEKRGLDYNRLGRTYLFDLDFWYLRGDKGEDEWKNKYVVDAFHVGNFTRFLNHSCDPNCHLSACYINDPDIERPLLTLFSLRDIQQNEELTFSYFGLEDEDDDKRESPSSPKKHQDDAIYGICHCGAAKCKGKLFT